MFHGLKNESRTKYQNCSPNRCVQDNWPSGLRPGLQRRLCGRRRTPRLEPTTTEATTSELAAVAAAMACAPQIRHHCKLVRPGSQQNLYGPLWAVDGRIDETRRWRGRCVIVREIHNATRFWVATFTRKTPPFHKNAKPDACRTFSLMYIFISSVNNNVPFSKKKLIRLTLKKTIRKR